MPFCLCSVLPGLVFSCSGASDVGEIADRATRRLEERGTAPMACLTGIAGRVSDVVTSAQAAEKLLVIDGCIQHCGKRCLEEAGFSDLLHLCLSDLNLEKGTSPVTDERVNRVSDQARKVLLV